MANCSRGGRPLLVVDDVLKQVLRLIFVFLVCFVENRSGISALNSQLSALSRFGEFKALSLSKGSQLDRSGSALNSTVRSDHLRARG